MTRRPKTMDEIVAQCRAQKVPCRVMPNSILVGSAGRGYAIYNPASGIFIGRTPRGFGFSSSKTKESVPWMKKLIRFFHEEIQ